MERWGEVVPISQTMNGISQKDILWILKIFQDFIKKQSSKEIEWFSYLIQFIGFSGSGQKLKVKYPIADHAQEKDV